MPAHAISFPRSPRVATSGGRILGDRTCTPHAHAYNRKCSHGGLAYPLPMPRQSQRQHRVFCIPAPHAPCALSFSGVGWAWDMSQVQSRKLEKRKILATRSFGHGECARGIATVSSNYAASGCDPRGRTLDSKQGELPPHMSVPVRDLWCSAAVSLARPDASFDGADWMQGIPGCWRGAVDAAAAMQLASLCWLWRQFVLMWRTPKPPVTAHTCTGPSCSGRDSAQACALLHFSRSFPSSAHSGPLRAGRHDADFQAIHGGHRRRGSRYSGAGDG